MSTFDPAEYLKTISDSGLNPPVELYVMVTTGCNLACRHCWPQAVPPANAILMDLQGFQTLIDNFISMGIQAISITGGEPLTHPHWADMLAYAVAKSEIDHICLQTNGTKLGPQNFTRLTSLPLEKVTIKVSLEGDQPALHDALRGKGAFARAMDGLKRLVKAGLGQKILISFTETRSSIEALPDLLALVDQSGMGHLVSGCLVDKGRAAQNPDLMLPEPDQYRALLNLYQNDAAFRERYDRLGNFSAIEWFKGKKYPLDHTCRCMATPIVTASGELYPCHMLPLERWRIEGVFSRPFGDVIAEAINRWDEIPAIYNRRGNEPAKCAACPGSAHCGGGCIGRVTDIEDGIKGVEDRCALRQAVYSWKNHP